MKVQLYYWKNHRWLFASETKDNPGDEGLPTVADFNTEFEQVATIETKDKGADIIALEYAFKEMNLHPEKYFNRTAYLRGIRHTSMSVGDIAVIEKEDIDNNFNLVKVYKFYVALSIGFQELAYDIEAEVRK